MNISLRHVVLFALCLSVLNVIGQPSWQWGKTLKITVDIMATDHLGNVYISWPLDYSYELEGESYTSHGLHDVALTSFDCNGNHRWTKIFGGASSDRGIAVGADTLGGVYWVGNVNLDLHETEVVHIGTDTAVVPNRKLMLLVKFDTDGNYQWHRMPEDSVIIDFTNIQVGTALDMDVSPDGDCFIYSKLPPGTYGDGAFEATYYGTSNFGEDVYVLRYDRHGNFTEGVHFDLYYAGGLFNHSEFTRDHQSGIYYLSGYKRPVNDTIVLGETTISTRSGYISSFDQTGEVNWVRIANDTLVDGWIVVSAGIGGKLVFDNEGNIYAAGGAGGSGGGFGDFTFYNSLGDITSCPAVFKFSPDGEVLNATNAASSESSGAYGVTLFDNIVAATGQSGRLIWGDLSIIDIEIDGYDVFLARFDADTFEPITLDSLRSSPLSNEFTNRIVSDLNSNLYIGGRFEGVLYVADDTLYNQSGLFEGFVAKFGSDVCPCMPPVAAFAHDTLPGEDGYAFAYTGSAEADSIVWDFGDGHTGNGANPHHLFAENGVYTVCVTVYNACGEDTYCADVTAIGPDAVRRVAGHGNIRIYPNPAHTTLSVAPVVAGTRIEVVNALGNRVPVTATASKAETVRMDIANLPPGVYLLILTDRAGERGYARFVKQ